MITRALAVPLAIAFALALAASTALATLLQAVRLSPIVAAARPSPQQWGEALGWAALAGLEPIAPAAFAIAAVLVLSRWHATGELLAARAAGLTAVRLAAGGLAVVVVAAVGLALHFQENISEMSAIV